METRSPSGLGQSLGSKDTVTAFAAPVQQGVNPSARLRWATPTLRRSEVASVTAAGNGTIGDGPGSS